MYWKQDVDAKNLVNRIHTFMKNRIVFIGDSFLSDKFSLNKIPCDKTQLWHYRLAQHLDMEYVNLAEDGVGNDWIVTQLAFSANQGEVRKDDLVVLGLSHFDRRWIVRNFAGASHLANLSLKNFQSSVLDSVPPQDRFVTKKQLQTGADYFQYCVNPALNVVEQGALITYAHYLKDLFGFKLLVLPTFLIEPKEEYKALIPEFNTCYEVKGFLNHSSICEFGPPELTIDQRVPIRNHWFLKMWQGGFDKRPNHLSDINHDILLDKMINTITNNAPLHLEDDFVGNLYN